MRFTVDTNVLVYAVDAAAPDKRAIAHDIITRGRTLDMTLTAQAIGEFLNVVRQRHADRFDQAIKLAGHWSLLFPTAPTLPDHLLNGARLALRRKIRFRDSVMLEVARDDRVEILLTEDMQDGAEYDGVRLINPFAVTNAAAIDTLLER